MTLPNDSHIAAVAATGTTVATHLVGGKEYEVVMLADDSGHLAQSLPSYMATIPNVVGAAAKIHWDLFNAVGSGKILEVRGLWCTPVLTTAVTGALSPDFDLIRTSAIGTGGTVVTEAATLPSVGRMDSNDAAPPAGITLRNAPTAGATSAVALMRQYITQEETQTGAQLAQWNNWCPSTAVAERFTAREGQGFKVVQNTLGVAQNFTWQILFTLI